MALTAKQQAFVTEYLACSKNLSEATRRPGYSEASAGVTGHRLLTDANISEEIQRRVSEKAMTADEVFIRLAEQARGTMDDFLTARDGIKKPYIDFEKARNTARSG